MIKNNKNYSIQEIKEIVEKMTVREKAEMLVGGSSMGTAKNERLGIKEAIFCDGPHGVRIEHEVADAVSFPSLSTLGATWNEELVHKVGTALASECIRFDKDMLSANKIYFIKTLDKLPIMCIIESKTEQNLILRWV